MLTVGSEHREREGKVTVDEEKRLDDGHARVPDESHLLVTRRLSEKKGKVA